MQLISAEILEQKIVESKMHISQCLPDKVEISVTCKAGLKTPKDKEDKSVLLNVHLNIDSGEDIRIELDADVFFELEKLLDNYDELVQKKLIPMACKSLLASVDVILIAMGYSKMGLADMIEDVAE